jgi:hypothetical protein
MWQGGLAGRGSGVDGNRDGQGGNTDGNAGGNTDGHAGVNGAAHGRPRRRQDSHADEQANGSSSKFSFVLNIVD